MGPEDELSDQDTDYGTQCGNYFMFNEGDVEDNGFKFCLFCGKEIET
ncbi:MAG: hypothetical protein KAS32_31015 [Candidatus Peribacteraceae bacterium]|nr:hypothetical protein [Candidatus Peribacteraceae bacterium]